MGFTSGCGNLLRDAFLRRFFRWPACNVCVVGIPLNACCDYPQPMPLKVAGPHIRASIKGACGLSGNILANAPEFSLDKLQVASR